MIEQDVWHVIAGVIYLVSLYQLRRGLVNNRSWFCFFFAYFFVGNILGYMLASLNDNNFHWIKELPETALHGKILVLAMTASWCGHFLVTRYCQSWTLKELPSLNFSEGVMDVMFAILALAGAFLALGLSFYGGLGYFVRPEWLVRPPYWLDPLKNIIAVCNGLLFLILARDFQKTGRPGNRGFAIAVFWVAAGLFTGFKYMVVIPGAQVVMSAWISRDLKLRYFLWLAFLVVLAYSVVEPLREAKIRTPDLTAMEGMRVVLGGGDFKLMDLSQVWDGFSRRLDLSATGVLTLDASARGYVQETPARMTEYFYYFPAMAFIPRQLWEEKPLANMGAVLYTEVTGLKGSSITPSTAVMTFIWKGWTGVTVIFTIWGVLCTFGGQLVMNAKVDFYRYSPFILLGLSLSQMSEVMASAYIDIMRLGTLLILIYALGILSYKRTPLIEGTAVP